MEAFSWQCRKRAEGRGLSAKRRRRALAWCTEFFQVLGQHGDGLVEVDCGEVRGGSFEVQPAVGDVPDREEPAAGLNRGGELLQVLGRNHSGNLSQLHDRGGLM